MSSHIEDFKSDLQVVRLTFSLKSRQLSNTNDISLIINLVLYLLRLAQQGGKKESPIMYVMNDYMEIVVHVFCIFFSSSMMS